MHVNGLGMDIQTEIWKELNSLCVKYDLRGCVFAAEMGNEFVGCVGIDGTKENMDSTIIKATMNAGRIYQSGREKTHKIIERF